MARAVQALAVVSVGAWWVFAVRGPAVERVASREKPHPTVREIPAFDGTASGADATAEGMTEVGIAGTILDSATGRPVSGAALSVAFHGGVNIGEALVAADDGAFRLPADRIPAHIIVKRDGYFDMTFTFPDAKGPPEEELVLPIVAAGSFLGKVIDARGGQPIPDATARFRDGAGNVVSEARADDQGEFSLSVPGFEVRVPFGKSPWIALDGVSLALSVEAQGFSSFDSWTPMAQVSARELNTGQARVLVLLQRELAIDGVVRDSSGSPVAGATVAWACQVVNGLTQSASVGVPTSTDSDGAFVWRGPAPTRNSVVWALHPDHGPGWIFIDRPLRKGVRLLEIVLPPMGRLSGRVVDDAGSGIAGVRVELQPTDVPPTWHYLSGKIVRELFGATPPWLAGTALEGSFEMTGLRPGLHRVSLTRTGLVPAEQTPTEIVVGADTRWEATLVAGRTVECSVVNQTGGPVAAARIRFLAKGVRIGMGILREDRVTEDWVQVHTQVRRADDGKLVAAGLPNGPLRVEALAPGFHRAQVDVEAAQDAVVVVLREGSDGAGKEEERGGADLSLSVRCGAYAVDAFCALVDFYPCGASRRTAQQMCEVRRGRAVVANAPPGLFDVVVEASGFEPAVLCGVVAPSERPLDIQLRRTVPVEATLDAPGPLKILSVHDGEGRRLRNAIVEPGNESTIDGLPAGDYWFRGRGLDDERYAAPTPVVLTGAEEITVRLERVPND